MTKEQFLEKWGWQAPPENITADLEAVIANEIAKVQPEKTNKIEITPHTLVEINRAFRALKQDRNSYIHKVFSDDGVFDAMEEIRKMFDNYFVEQQQEQPALNPIAEAYERGEKIRHKRWIKGEWLKKHTQTSSIDSYGRIDDLFTTRLIETPSDWEIYTKPDQVTDQVTEQEQPEKTEKEKIDHILTNKLTWKPMGNKRFYANWFSAESDEGYRQVHFVDYNNPHSGYFETRIFTIDLAEWQPVETKQPSSQVILDNSFDKDRFERMFCAVVASGGTDVLATVNKALAELDAYYAEKQGGDND